MICQKIRMIICVLIWKNSFLDFFRETQNSTTLYMTRCDYDAMFYRVFCITLLAIAFTFTVILTSVFIDIDGLLVSKKEHHKDNIIRKEFTTESADNDDMIYGDSDDSYRTKRSIETQSFLFHIKNPKVKNILANRLSTLLEELEAGESNDMKPTEKNKIKEERADTIKEVDAPKISDDVNKDKMLRVSMHNVLLEGIERRMDLNDVYKKMFSLMTNFNNFHDRKDGSQLKPNESGRKEGEKQALPKSMEQFIDEMLNYNELQSQVAQSTTVKPVKAPPNVMIKTVIDITSIDNNKVKDNDTKLPNENIQGDVELIYNGKVIKFTNSDANKVQPLPKKKIPVAFIPQRTIETTTTDYFNMIPKTYMSKFVEEYFKHFPHDTKESTSNEINRHFQTKRLKRHVRIKYENDNSNEPKNNFKKNTEEDELYVEIETHFDSKGMKGEKKKKLIKSLVEKIQKAIHSDMPGKLVTTGKNNTKAKGKSVHFRKRIQNPLEHTNQILASKNPPIASIVHRHLHPISKTVPLEDSMSPAIGTKSGEEWRKANIGPGFLASTKAINSAEMSEVDVDYSKILEMNGIPQRLQLPLNTELSEETIKTNSYYDMGKMKFVIKDIDGSGFSIGFNQYVDEPPDKESMKLFSGIENVIKSYHQTYDPVNDPSEPSTTTESMLGTEERRSNLDVLEPISNEHIIERRSINEKNDYHSNEYKVIFENDFMPYKDYRDIYKTKKEEKHKHHIKKDKKSPLVLDENIFEKNLKPSEILSLANLFDRKKRAIKKVKQISNLKSRFKVNRFLNTNAMSKTLFLNTKRNKRQINKIRIIATDLPQQSDENVFVVSDENVFADRALLKEVETSDDREKQEEPEYFSKYANNEPNTYITKVFDGRSRHNLLMSKYPHIFMEEVSRSKEDYIPNNALLFGKLPGLGRRNTEVENEDEKIDIEHFMTPPLNETEGRKQFKDQDMISALLESPVNKPNYKVTVKIIPKNQTGVNSGFKEIHTSINKSFNKNGLMYSSLVNVSEISKVVKLNKTNEEFREDKPYSKKEESIMSKKIHDQQEKMQFLLKQHARHINEQLHRLYEEKMNLEAMLSGDNNTDLYNYALNLTTRRLKLAADKVEAPKATTEAVKEVQLTTINNKPQNLEPSTTQPTHTTKLLNFQERVRNNNIISTIERNGNLTDQILKKIDRNTEILKVFLQKLTERIETPSTVSPKPEIVKDDNTYSPNWTNQGAPFTQNMVIRKNDSHISIPFTYSYQPPTSLPVKTQVASVVYQGHIRNAVRNSEKDNQFQKIQEATNQSRFFIDDLENEYKIIQMGQFKKNMDNLVKNNTVT